MKKLFALLLVLAMVFALAACASNESKETDPVETEPTETQPAETEPEETEPEIVYDFYQYTFVEDRGDFEVTWTLTVMGDVYSLDESNGMSGETVTHGLDECVVDVEAGTVSTGAWSDSDSNKSEFFAPNGACEWVITGDKTFEPANLDEVSSESEGGVNPGKYTIGETGWYIMLKGSGEYALQEGDDGDQISGTEWTDNGDGTITTGALADPSTAPEFLNGGDGSGTWTINEDGTAAFEG